MLHQSECGCRSKGGIIIHPAPAVQLNSSEYNLITAADLCAQQYLESWLQYVVNLHVCNIKRLWAFKTQKIANEVTFFSANSGIKIYGQFYLHFVFVLVCFSSTKEAIFYAFIESLLNWLMVEMWQMSSFVCPISSHFHFQKLQNSPNNSCKNFPVFPAKCIVRRKRG